MAQSGGSRRGRGQSPGDRLLFAAFVAAVALLLFIGGSLATTAGIWPGPQIARAYAGGLALYRKVTQYDDVYRSDLWHPAKSAAKGVVDYDPVRADSGVTLYTTGDKAAAYLIDMHGRVLHSWQKPYSQVWRPDAEVKHPLADSHVYFRKAMLDRDGNLIALYEGVGDTPYGYGLVKLAPDSHVIWRFLEHVHHDFDIAPDGRIYALTHRIVEGPVDGLNKIASPRIEDFIAVLSPSGDKLEEVRLLPIVRGSEFRQLLYTVSAYAVADPLHANTVHVITAAEAEHFPFGKAGQLLVSFRELNAIGVIDLSQRKLVWAARGYWLGQHDPHILANGDLLMFDNFGNFDRPSERSRALEIDPKDMRIVWQYAGTAADPLNSAIRSYTQRLGTGDTLITESNGGRMLEVTPGGEIVWQYVNPVRGGKDGMLIPIICKGQRFAADAPRVLKVLHASAVKSAAADSEDRS